MTNTDIVFLTLCVHELLCGALLLAIRRRGHSFNFAHFGWIELVPIFGPLAGFALARSLGRTPPDADWLPRQEEKHRISIVSRSKVEITVPLEEALLINDPHERRNLMMNILRSDPMRYLDLLLIARNNDDTETAHYATASIMEIQRQFQLELQQLQLRLTKEPTDLETHNQYIDLLSRYCQSGLLEGQLLRRQQLLLKGALDDALALETDPVLLRIKVGNCLALKDAEEAKSTVRKLIDLYPKDEKSWLEGMRVYAEIRDQEGMRRLLKRIQEEKVDFTAAGREHLSFFRGLQA
ncbi:MAG TPA: hypothetical protein PK537_03045 [Candidatus Limiplasma sp.]|nr:hypothetical protein [Candidatus Limiplasma sp.]